MKTLHHKRKPSNSGRGVYSYIYMYDVYTYILYRLDVSS